MASSPSGIVTRQNGGPGGTTAGRVIPQSRRADGTLRREIRIRDGYTPPEDVEKYANEKVAGRAKLAPGEVIGAPSHSPAARGGGGDRAQLTKAQKKNERRKAAKAAAAVAAADDDDDAGRADALPAAWSGEGERDGPGPAPAPATAARKADAGGGEEDGAAAAATKKLKGLQKRLRQAEGLREKRDAGDILRPEELEKVDRIEHLLEEIAALHVR
ncbi:MAG: hypothetical protein BJ554DRAFT_3660 [Olpidium bornovanus]|uniref:WIBG Mago-binding domain-containing protein n=1 Tax=Olpidium bornovanus TaxID=278681 RepID=A0A8H8DFD7_9FUNG|nr:MAG: hypothetical protein BJ554DRAFT_3660 [Olpidium bornovanus]